MAMTMTATPEATDALTAEMNAARAAVAALPRLKLAHLPTPLEEEPRLLPQLLPLLPPGPGGGELPARLPQLFVKRDDLSGLGLSGNKVRKLELLLAEAVEQGADTVITCGGVQSNHCRATALAAARLGLRSVLLLRAADPSAPQPLVGNLLLDRLAGATVRLISPADYARRAELLAEVAAELLASGRRGYIIPEGGSNALGSLGYVRCIDELCEQVPEPERPLTVVYAAGSGGTGAGLLYGVALRGLPWRVVGVNVCDDRAYFVRRIGEILYDIATLFRPDAGAQRAVSQARRAIDIRDGYVGRGYALSRPEELRLLTEAARATGLLFDPVYTGKALLGLCSELRRAPHELDERVLFVHTGGVFGLLAAAPELAPVLSEADREAAREADRTGVGPRHA
ncbi:MAG: pyridoxal-phosphate dependent enzyme [Polyangia bacterium]